MSSGWGNPRAELRAERILRAVEAIPPGTVVAYSDIARIVGCGARQVGSVLRTHGGAVPWWRVVAANGRSTVASKALDLWRSEGISVLPGMDGCAISVHRADLVELADAYRTACQDLPPLEPDV